MVKSRQKKTPADEKTDQKEAAGVITEVINLVKERWPLVVGSIVFLVLLVIASQYVYKHGIATRSTSNEPCVIKLLIETESGGQQWMTITPKDNTLSRADFEEMTRIHRIEIVSCL
ncbi:MAG: hypothetical protein GXP09_04010 [Gammaproteobacteria bacterium]|nr:hypothetical protein [Gammaproteobacteria bacterium]